MEKQKIKKSGIFVLELLLIIFLFNSVYAETAIERILSNGKLVVGLEPDYPPFEFNEKDTLVGFDIDIASELAKRMKVEVVFKEHKFEELIPALQENKIDMIISGMTKNLERALKVNFTDPYFKTGQVVVVGKKHKEVIEFKELNNKDVKIGFQKDTTGEITAKKHFPSAELISFDHMQKCRTALLTEKIDAFVFDRPLAEIFVREHRDQADILSAELTTEYYCFAVKQGDFDFFNWLNYFISELIKSGNYADLYQYWFVDEAWKK